MRRRVRLERLPGRLLDVARLTIDGGSYDLTERDLRLLGEDLLRVLAQVTRDRALAAEGSS